MAKLKPWYQVVTPREDLREGKALDASEFAVHLGAVQAGTAHPDYTKPDRFFDRTFLTKSLLDLSAEVVRRLSGEVVETSAVFNMATQFGGGKTHALTALFHLATGGDAGRGWKGVSDILQRARVNTLPRADVAIFVGTEFDALSGRSAEGEPTRRTPWGEIAWQLGGQKAYDIVAEHDAKGIAPGGDVITKMLPSGPVLILMDELMNYVSGARKRGMRSEVQRFLQNLCEVARGRDRLVLCVSMPSSSDVELPDPDDRTDYEALKKVLDRVGKAVSMSTEAADVTEIVRRRLFEWNGLSDDANRAAAAYAEWAREHAGELANISTETVVQQFRASYPFHPTVISVFERKWQSLQRFQRTRGILRLLALWVSRAYRDGYGHATGDPLIDLGSAPFTDPTFCDAVFEQLGDDRLRVPVQTDIAGKPESHAIQLDREATESVKKRRLHQKAASVIFFESNGGQSQAKADATTAEIKTALGGPEFNFAELDTALESLGATCYYLVWDRNKYRFGLRPNLNQILVNSRGSIKDKEITQRLRQETDALFRDGAKGIDRKPFPVRSNDVPDKPQLTLVFCGMEHPAGDSATTALVDELLRNNGSTARTFKSALLIAIPERDHKATDAARTLLAWEDISEDQDTTTRLDESEKARLERNLKRARADLREALFRCYRHVAYLGRDNKPIVQDLGNITSSSIDGGRIADLIIDELKKKDEIVSQVGPTKLTKFWPPAKVDWSTKDVRNAFFASPLLPRLLDADSIRHTIADGVASGILGYGFKTDKGTIRLDRFQKPMLPAEVEISDEAVILTAEEAKKLIEPPRLASLTISPDGREILPGEVITFTALGRSQYGEEFETGPLAWSATGGTIDASGRFTAGATAGIYNVDARSGAVHSSGTVRVRDKSLPPPPPPPPGGQLLLWTGEVPHQKWMNFYTKVLTGLVASGELKLRVTVESPLKGAESDQTIERVRIALRELGLSEDINS